MTVHRPRCPCGAYITEWARRIGHACAAGDAQPTKYLKANGARRAQALALRARGLTYREIGAEMGISFQRAYQLTH